MTVYSIEADRVLLGSQAHVTDPKASDGVVPRKFWVSPNGTDGDGNGGPDTPFLTITFALTKCVDGRGDTIYVGPGEYAERVSVTVKNVAIIGTGGRHTGCTQIIGDTSTARATVYVGADYLRGFKLANVELDSQTVSGTKYPALHLVTSNTDSGSQSNTDLRAVIENVAVRSSGPSVGVLLEGATLVDFRKLLIQGPTIGIGFCGSADNIPADLDFEDVDFHDCVTADIATLNDATMPPIVGTLAGMERVKFLRPRHWDRGGTPVTNYVNMAGANMVNVHFFNAYAARDVADGTLLELPANVVWLGHSAGGVESIVGA